MTRRHKLLAWIVDDTGFPKKGIHSVGVTRQYCGQVGPKVESEYRLLSAARQGETVAREYWLAVADFVRLVGFDPRPKN